MAVTVRIGKQLGVDEQPGPGQVETICRPIAGHGHRLT